MEIEIDGVRLYASVRGSGPPLLLVHGFPLHGGMWDGVAERLEDRARVVVPDLRGHGRSEPSRTATMRRYADDLVAVLDAAGENGPVVVVGMSMGGYVALEMVRRHPDRVRALAMIASRAGADTPEAVAGRRETAARVLREGSAPVAAGMVDRLFAPSAADALRAYWHQEMAATPPAGVAAALRAMARRPDSRRTLKRLHCPLLVVVGADDGITPPTEARAMAEAAPDARLRVIAEAGHMVPVERPAEVAAALRDFVDRLDAASAAPSP